MLRPLIGAHITVEIDLDTSAGIVFADPGELQRALLNLCLNARDAMPNGGTLVLKTEASVLGKTDFRFALQMPAGRCVIISVIDTGCGMTPETKQRLFEPFFTTKEVGKGTGLGLATVFGIVQQHVGAIDFSSEQDAGTTFRIYLPVVNQAQDANVSQPCPEPANGKETILIAEDEPLVRSLTVRTLQKAGYTVLAACDGEEALRTYAEHHDTIQLVILDAIMPKLNGHEVCRRIKAQDPRHAASPFQRLRPTNRVRRWRAGRAADRQALRALRALADGA